MTSSADTAGSSWYIADGDLPPSEVLFGRSEAMEEVRQKVEKAAQANVPVLIQGESGTGKEVLAKFLHCGSPWADGPFVKVNCPAIPGTLVESELFGYEKGAFTGAYISKPGRVELAHRGTLFLDEIAEIDPTLQAKLLQFLQDGQFSSIGSREERRVEVRVICATNRDLEHSVKARTFREDLFYRINVINVRLSPLRKRIADIPGLVNYFLGSYNNKYQCRAPQISARLVRLLQSHDWPGNIRELENLIKRYVVFGSEEVVSSALLGKDQSQFSSVADLSPEEPIPLKKLTRQAVRELERRIMLKVLEAKHWNRKEAARALHISYRALLYKIKEAGLPSKRASLSDPLSDDSRRHRGQTGREG